MANKKDGITDLTRLLVTAAGRFTPSQYKNLTSTIFALLNGVNYGYTELGPRFLHDAQDIYDIHKKDLPNTSFVKNKKNKKQIQTHDNVINLQHYKFWSQDK
jgi:hypothetical protein